MSDNKMHTHELDIDGDLVRELVSIQFPQWANLSIKQVKSAGTDYAIYRLGTDMCVRLPRIAQAAEYLETEQKWLPFLAPKLSLPIPILLALGKPHDRYPLRWGIYEWIEGENAFAKSIGDSSQAATALALFLRALQKIDPSDAALSRRGMPLSTLDDEVRSAIKSLHGVVDTQALTLVWDECLAAPEWHKPSVWTHGDLLPGNILVHKDKINAIIDFSLVGIGDPACDMLPAWAVFSRNTRKIFRTQLGVDDATWLRGRGRALSIAITIIPYYQQSNPELVAVAHRILQEILADHLELKF